ncbi:hypothetical protein Nepgr_028929 [Nepenthes gracilis]|uniref:Uncharacterized protein n=1 Tax=Nepenthes gracilis TaxID=150966 RepID=A0AAD3TDE0_NEPGR|nr:hypothetical protein Nepgr_028929 [Nepenthes gracilis]
MHQLSPQPHLTPHRQGTPTTRSIHPVASTKTPGRRGQLQNGYELRSKSIKYTAKAICPVKPSAIASIRMANGYHLQPTSPPAEIQFDSYAAAATQTDECI